VEWEDTCSVPKVKRVGTVYKKTDVSNLQNILHDKFVIRASNSRKVEGIWNNFKNIEYESIERFVPHKIALKNSDPEYYNKEIMRLNKRLEKHITEET